MSKCIVMCMYIVFTAAQFDLLNVSTCKQEGNHSPGRKPTSRVQHTVAIISLAVRLWSDCGILFTLYFCVFL